VESDVCLANPVTVEKDQTIVSVDSPSDPFDAAKGLNLDLSKVGSLKLAK